MVHVYNVRTQLITRDTWEDGGDMRIPGDKWGYLRSYCEMWGALQVCGDQENSGET
jgi:hypothetical protein